MINIAIVGAAGRMGKVLIEALCRSRKRTAICRYRASWNPFYWC